MTVTEKDVQPELHCLKQLCKLHGLHPPSCAQRVISTESDQHSVPRQGLSMAPVKEAYTHQSLCCGPKCSCFQRTEPTTSAGITHRPYNWEASKRLLRPRQGWETSGGACARPFQGFKTRKAFAVHWQPKGTGGLWRHLTLPPNSAAANTTYPRMDAQMLRGIIQRIKKNSIDAKEVMQNSEKAYWPGVTERLLCVCLFVNNTIRWWWFAREFEWGYLFLFVFGDGALLCCAGWIQTACMFVQAGFRLHVCLRAWGHGSQRMCCILLPTQQLEDTGSFPFPSDPPASPSTLVAHFKCL